MNLKAAFLYAAAAAFLVLTGLAAAVGGITAVTDPQSAIKLYCVAAATFITSAFLLGAAK